MEHKTKDRFSFSFPFDTLSELLEHSSCTVPTYVILPHLIRSIVLVCQRFQILRLRDPVEVSLQILFQLLFLSKFLEVPTVLGLLSFFGELSGKIRILVKIIIKKELYNDDNVVMYVTELILWKLRTLHKTNGRRSYNSRKIAAGLNSLKKIPTSYSVIVPISHIYYYNRSIQRKHVLSKNLTEFKNFGTKKNIN